MIKKIIGFMAAVVICAVIGLMTFTISYADIEGIKQSRGDYVMAVSANDLKLEVRGYRKVVGDRYVEMKPDEVIHLPMIENVETIRQELVTAWDDMSK